MRPGRVNKPWPVPVRVGSDGSPEATASLSRFGVLMRDPLKPTSPNPKSSVRITTKLGGVLSAFSLVAAPTNGAAAAALKKARRENILNENPYDPSTKLMTVNGASESSCTITHLNYLKHRALRQECGCCSAFPGIKLKPCAKASPD